MDVIDATLEIGKKKDHSIKFTLKNTPNKRVVSKEHTWDEKGYEQKARFLGNMRVCGTTFVG